LLHERIFPFETYEAKHKFNEYIIDTPMDQQSNNLEHVRFLNEFHSELTAQLMVKQMETDEKKLAMSIENRKKELDEYYMKNMDFIRKCTVKSISISSFTMKAIELEGQEIKVKILNDLERNS